MALQPTAKHGGWVLALGTIKEAFHRIEARLTWDCARSFDLSESSTDGEEELFVPGGWGYRKGNPMLLANLEEP